MSLAPEQDTIVAPATGPGPGAIAVTRISGKEAFALVNGVFRGADLASVASHTIHFGTIRDGATVVDEVLVSVFRGPNSYTGEDVLEISTHGSAYIQQQLTELLIREGARAANPGEFTQRAFLNGKLDLSQAEAVADLIASDSKASHQLAMHQMRGGFSAEIKKLREELINFASLIELELDFSEEDVEFANRDELKALLLKAHGTAQALIDSFRLGNVLKNGVPVAIIGKPNAGKSTLLNALLNEDRAIVSDIAGTTRDAIEDEVTLDGVRFRFIDTAGLRDTEDTIEAIGVERSKAKMREAAVVIYLFDVTDESKAEARTTAKELQEELEDGVVVLVVGNKADLEGSASVRGSARGRNEGDDESGFREGQSPDPGLSENTVRQADPEEIRSASARGRSEGDDESGLREASDQGLSESTVRQADPEEIRSASARGRSEGDDESGVREGQSSDSGPTKTVGGQGQLASTISISAKNNEGLKKLTTALAAAVDLNASNRQDTILTNARHVQALSRANEALLRAHQGLSNGTTGDFVAMDIRQALHHLGEITGEITTDDLLGNIFSRFCIGK